MHELNKIVFIVPYFGRFNNYFQLFLNSCEKNSNYNWIIITDDKRNFYYPKNVEVIYESFEKLKEQIQTKFENIEISLDNPYKLCDYKPTYGYIFEKNIEKYDYWGYCDVDLIFGNIEKCLDMKKIKKYDKIGVLGHFTIFRNTKELRELFLNDERYKEVLTSPKSFKFDEEYGEDYGNSINNIFQKKNKKIYNIINLADIYVKSSNFKLINYNNEEKKYFVENYKKNLFVYDDGNLKRYTVENNKLVTTEYLYIHLQKRSMNVNINNFNKYKIIPNSFENFNENINSIQDFQKIKIKNFNLHYFKIRLKNLKNKIKKRMEEK